MAPSGATIPGQRGPGSNGNEGVHRYSITGTSASDCLVSYPGLSLGSSNPSVELQSVHSTVSANWASTNLKSTNNHIHMYTQAHVRTYIQTYIHVLMPTRMRTVICKNIYIYIYIYICTHISNSIYYHTKGP